MGVAAEEKNYKKLAIRFLKPMEKEP